MVKDVVEDEDLDINEDPASHMNENDAKVEQTDGKYVCNPCDHQFTTQSNLTIHIKSKHEGVKYACIHCDQQFTAQSSLTVP